LTAFSPLLSTSSPLLGLQAAALLVGHELTVLKSRGAGEMKRNETTALEASKAWLMIRLIFLSFFSDSTLSLREWSNLQNLSSLLNLSSGDLSSKKVR
jgi:hypothetical protein